jgi:5-deoxy-5-amino-3-dehydroquinate synthase
MTETSPHLVLVGMMGAGKTTVGRYLARRLGWRHVDADKRTERAAGCSIADYFASHTEDEFRRLEHDVLTKVLDASGPCVVSTGGGAVLRDDTRSLLRRRGTVVWLRASVDTLVERVGSGQGRPLLADDPRGALTRLLAARAPLYEQAAHVVVDVDGLEAEEVAGLVLGRVSLPTPAIGAAAPAELDVVERADDGLFRVPVELGERSYEVIVGAGARHHLAALVPPRAKRVAVVTQAGIPVEVDPGVEHRVFTIVDGEEAKDLETIGRLCSEFAQWGLTRADAVVGVGGGVVTDVAGFAASVYHRGIPVVHVATTLLGQIDAAIGGKTGVNLPEGKNLVGAFWQPSGVVCDTDTLATLPARELRAGLGELAKYHFLGGGRLDDLPIDERVARCVAIKADVVGGDEREGGRRAILNYGHTLAHALETAGRYDLRHGEAVAIGLIYAAEVAHRIGRIDDARVAEHRRVVAGYDLPVTLPPGVGPDDVLPLFARDKKALDGITFVLDGPAGVEPVTGIPTEVLTDALEALR